MKAFAIYLLKRLALIAVVAVIMCAIIILLNRSSGQSLKEFREQRVKEWETAVARKEVLVGMPASYALRAWGPPTSRHEKTTQDSSIVLWIYNEGSLTFENGKLTQVRTSR
jgi:hypothetical protein